MFSHVNWIVSIQIAPTPDLNGEDLSPHQILTAVASSWTENTVSCLKESHKFLIFFPKLVYDLHEHYTVTFIPPEVGICFPFRMPSVVSPPKNKSHVHLDAPLAASLNKIHCILLGILVKFCKSEIVLVAHFHYSW